MEFASLYQGVLTQTLSLVSILFQGVQRGYGCAETRRANLSTSTSTRKFEGAFSDAVDIIIIGNNIGIT